MSTEIKGIKIGDSVSAWLAFSDENKIKYVEPAVTELYQNLSNIAGGGDLHCLRFLSMLNEGDLICLPTNMVDMAMELANHFAETGTDTLKFSDIILTDEYGEMSSMYDGDIDEDLLLVFMFDERAAKKFGDRCRSDTTIDLESKVNFACRWLEDNIVSLPTSSIVLHGKDYFAISSQASVSGTAERIWKEVEESPGFLKLEFTASGNGSANFDSFDDLKNLLSECPWKSSNFVAQKKVGTDDISVNYYVDELGANFAFATKQKNKGISHEANFQNDILYERVSEMTDRIVSWAYMKGFRGFIGFDLRVDSKTREMWIIECNARVTAPVYSWCLARKHDAPWFGTVSLKNLIYSTIDGALPADLRYSPEKREGIIMHNPGPLREGVCSITLLATHKEVGVQYLSDLCEHLYGRPLVDLPELQYLLD